MEKRLWYGIAWPGMVGTYVFGSWLFYSNLTYYFSSPWFILKLAFVFGLTLYHLQCHVMVSQFRRSIIHYSSLKLRLWNEVATIFLVAIVFIVILKDTLSFVWGIIGLLLFAGMIFAAIYLYKKGREKKGE